MLISLVSHKYYKDRMRQRKEAEQKMGIDLELVRLRYPDETREFYNNKTKSYRWLVEETLTSLKAKYPNESEVSYFKRIQEFCILIATVFESEDNVSLRVEKLENFYWMLDMILASLDKKFLNETEKSHMERIQEFCWSITKMFMPLDENSSSYDVNKSDVKEMDEFYWFLNMTLSSIREKYPHETKEYHIKVMEEYLWLVDMVLMSIGNIHQSEVKKIKEYWGLE